MRTIYCATVTVLIVFIRGCFGVAIDGACSNDAECTDDNPNTYCKPHISATCAKGTCVCLQNMDWTSSTCKVKKYFVDKCSTSSTSCQGGSVCSGTDGQCVCNGVLNNYYDKLQKCITHTAIWKVIGETCTTVDDCYQDISGAVECVVPSGESEKTCMCTSGFVMDQFSCRKPHYGESCTSAVGCAHEVSVIESSIVIETCSTNNICTCASGSTQKSMEYNGLIANVCMTDFTGTLLADEASCSASNTCSSSLCMTCPEDTSDTCVVSPAS